MVGGGYIAAEFSHIAARAGTQVTVLQRGERMLTHFDPDLLKLLGSDSICRRPRKLKIHGHIREVCG